MMPQQAGLEANAMVKVNIAVKSLIDALGQIKDVGSDMGKGIVDALRVLSKVVPEVSESLSQSEVASMMGGATAIKPQGQGMQPQGQPPTMLGTARPMPLPMR